LRQQADLAHQLAAGPRQLQLAETSKNQFAARLEATRTLHKQTRVAADQKQLTLREREEKVAKLKTARNQCASNKEYQLFTEQIAAEQQANEVLSDEILELLEKVDALAIDIRTAESNLATAQREWETVQSQVAERQAALQRELDRVTGELAIEQDRLPRSILSDFRRSVSLQGENALAAVEDQTCGHCNQMLTVQKYNELRAGAPLFCTSCGSLMYLPQP
jgi:predicted  nucleic acid-binding Zn-ribbon protein